MTRHDVKIRLDEIREAARKTFGSDHSGEWLTSPSRFFDRKTPIEYASEKNGAEKVLEHIKYYQRGSV